MKKNSLAESRIIRIQGGRPFDRFPKALRLRRSSFSSAGNIGDCLHGASHFFIANFVPTLVVVAETTLHKHPPLSLRGRR